MTIKWERFSGNTDVFALRISFMPDPDVGRAADPDEAASWGSIQIWVRGQNLCSHVDQGEVLQAAHWYLLPMLEWVASNWNALLHEERLPNGQNADSAATALGAAHFAPTLAGEVEALIWEEDRFTWWGRHALRSAREGGLYPNVVIRRVRDSVELSWNDEQIAGAPVGFGYNATSGTALLDPDDVAESLFEILSKATEYLAKVQSESGRIKRLLSAVAGLVLPGQYDARMSWLTGLRETVPLDGRIQGRESQIEMQSRWESIVASLRSDGREAAAAAALESDESRLVVSGSSQAALLFSSVSPTINATDVDTLTSVLLDQYVGLDKVVTLDRFVTDKPLSAAVPAWEQGYELAEIVHEWLNADLSSGWVDIAALLDQLGVDILPRKLDDGRIRACAIIGPWHKPTIVQNEASLYNRSTVAQRFTLAHELCHLLFDHARGRRLAIASGPWAPRGIEKRANAFAAMFLMPTDLLQDLVADAPDPVGDIATVVGISDGLRVGRRAVVEHLYNMTLMTESDRDELLRRLAERVL